MGAAIFGLPVFRGVILVQLIVGRGISLSSKSLSFKWNKLTYKGFGPIFQ